MVNPESDRMVDHWDNPDPAPTVLTPLDDEADSPNGKLGALAFVIWSVFMMAIGFMISLMVQGHIIFR